MKLISFFFILKCVRNIWRECKSMQMRQILVCWPIFFLSFSLSLSLSCSFVRPAWQIQMNWRRKVFFFFLLLLARLVCPALLQCGWEDSRRTARWGFWSDSLQPADFPACHGGGGCVGGGYEQAGCFLKEKEVCGWVAFACLLSSHQRDLTGRRAKRERDRDKYRRLTQQ